MKAIFFALLFMFGIWVVFGSMLPASDPTGGGSLAAAPSAPPPVVSTVSGPNMGAWQISLGENLIDDSGRAAARLLSANTLANSIGVREPARLYIRCSAGTFTVAVVWPAFIGIEDHVGIRYRVDSRPLVPATWRGSTSGTSVFVVNPAELVDTLRGATELVVELVPYGRGREEALFQVTGIGAAVAEVIQACSPAPL